MEASERDETKRNLTQLKRFSDKKPSEEKEAWSSQVAKERTPTEQWSEEVAAVEEANKKSAAEEKSKTPPSEKKDVGKPEVVKQDNVDKNAKSDIKEIVKEGGKAERKEEEREKREKSEKSGKVKSRGRSDSGRGRQGLFMAFRNSHGSRGERRRRDSGRISGRNRSDNRDWIHGSETEGSGDEVSASTESGKEDKKGEGSRPPKSRVQLKKVEKEERNKETRKAESGDSKSSFQSSNTGGPRFERKSEFPSSNREGFAPSGQPSRRGRGTARMRGGIGRRMDGYGPMSAKSPFGHTEDKKSVPNEKSNESVADDKPANEEEKKQKQLALNSSGSNTNVRSGSKASQVASRSQKRSEHEQR